MVAEEVRDVSLPPTQFFMEQPEDPANYRSQQDVQQHKYFSLFRTAEWKALAETYNLKLLSFDQFPMGHSKRKPTSMATNVPEMMQLDQVRGAPPNEAEMANKYKAMSMEQRCATSKTWSAWAPGLKLAIATAICQNIQVLDQEERAKHVSVQPRTEGPGQPMDQFSVQSLEPQSLQSHESQGYATGDNFKAYLQPNSTSNEAEGFGADRIRAVEASFPQ